MWAGRPYPKSGYPCPSGGSDGSGEGHANEVAGLLGAEAVAALEHEQKRVVVGALLAVEDRLVVATAKRVQAADEKPHLTRRSAAMTLDAYADLFDDDLDGVAVALDEARAAALVVKALSDGNE